MTSAPLDILDSGFNNNGAGRPTKLTKEVVTKLVTCFQYGMSDTLACSYAKVSRNTFYRYLKENEEFRDKIEEAKQFVTMRAAEVVVNQIVESKNPKWAAWWLERKDQVAFGRQVINIQNNQMAVLRQQYEKKTDSEIEAEFEKLFGSSRPREEVITSNNQDQSKT